MKTTHLSSRLLINPASSLTKWVMEKCAHQPSFINIPQYMFSQRNVNLHIPLISSQPRCLAEGILFHWFFTTLSVQILKPYRVQVGLRSFLWCKDPNLWKVPLIIKTLKGSLHTTIFWKYTELFNILEIFSSVTW